MISVIIPTRQNPEALNLCLKSAIKSQNAVNDIVVVVDGDLYTNKDVLNTYSKYINVVILPDNVGMSKAQNIGVYNAKYQNILIVNDDNVFPKYWDSILSKVDIKNSVVAPNQIEPYNSIFRQFHIKDLGRDPQTFDLETFWEYEQTIRNNLIEHTGCTYPIYMNKLNYLQCGGFDVDYPTMSGAVADWDFFLKCEIHNWKMIRIYSCMFYHFVSTTRKKPEASLKSQQIEDKCKEYFKNKWGFPVRHNFSNNSKMISELKHD